jgi:hypothetical protein
LPIRMVGCRLLSSNPLLVESFAYHTALALSIPLSEELPLSLLSPVSSFSSSYPLFLCFCF